MDVDNYDIIKLINELKSNRIIISYRQLSDIICYNKATIDLFLACK